MCEGQSTDWFECDSPAMGLEDEIKPFKQLIIRFTEQLICFGSKEPHQYRETFLL